MCSIQISFTHCIPRCSYVNIYFNGFPAWPANKTHLCLLVKLRYTMNAQAIIKVSGHQYRWLAGGYDLEIGHV